MWWPGKHQLQRPWFARWTWWRAFRIGFIHEPKGRYFGCSQSWYDGPIYTYGLWFFEINHYECAHLIFMWTDIKTFNKMVENQLPVSPCQPTLPIIGKTAMMIYAPDWIAEACKFYESGLYSDMDVVDFLIKLFKEN